MVLRAIVIAEEVITAPSTEETVDRNSRMASRKSLRNSIGTESAAFRKLTRRDAVKSGLGAKGSLEARMFFATMRPPADGIAS